MAVGCGWQTFVAYVNVACYYVIGIPLGSVLGFKFNLGAKVLQCFSFYINLESFQGRNKLSLWQVILNMWPNKIRDSIDLISSNWSSGNEGSKREDYSILMYRLKITRSIELNNFFPYFLFVSLFYILRHYTYWDSMLIFYSSWCTQRRFSLQHNWKARLRLYIVFADFLNIVLLVNCREYGQECWEVQPCRL